MACLTVLFALITADLVSGHSSSFSQPDRIDNSYWHIIDVATEEVFSLAQRFLPLPDDQPEGLSEMMCLWQVGGDSEMFSGDSEMFSFAQRERCRGGVLVAKASATPVSEQLRIKPAVQNNTSSEKQLPDAGFVSVKMDFEGNYEVGSLLQTLYPYVHIESGGFGWFRGRDRGDPDNWHLCGGDGSDAYGIWPGANSTITFGGLANLISLDLMADCENPPNIVQATLRDEAGQIVDMWSVTLSKDQPFVTIESKALNVRTMEWQTSHGHAIDNIRFIRSRKGSVASGTNFAPF